MKRTLICVAVVIAIQTPIELVDAGVNAKRLHCRLTRHSVAVLNQPKTTLLVNYLTWDNIERREAEMVLRLWPLIS